MSDRKPTYLLENQDTNIAVMDAGNTNSAFISDGDFVVDVWSPTGNFDGGSVNVYMMSRDNTPILLESFLQAGARFGRVGQIPRVFKAELAGGGGNADVCVTVSN